MNLKDKKILIYDRGLYTFLAEKLAESFGKVYYHVPESEPFPTSIREHVGEGLDGVECVDSFWRYVNQADLIFFPDCYDGDLQDWLRRKGYKVFGSGQSEIIELDKWRFINVLKAVGLPCPETVLVTGLDALEKHLSGAKEEKWLKARYCRGDFDSKRYHGMDHLYSWINHLRSRLGASTGSIEVLVQDVVDASCEPGYDGFCVDGEYLENTLCGYEIKDTAYLGKVFEETPRKLKAVNYKMSPVFRKLGGYRGHYSTEIRIDRRGVPFFIDPTCRAASPPTELLCEMLANYGEVVWDVAFGKIPRPRWKAKYGAQMILHSSWHEDHELHVEFPDEIRPFVKLKNAMKRDGKYYCIPNQTEGYFGGVIAFADTSDEAARLCLDRLKAIDCDGLDKDMRAFEEAKEQIKGGEKWGISWE